MSITPFLRSSSLWNPFVPDASCDPFDVFKIWSAHEPALSVAKDAHAIVNTKVDWKETEEAHVFTADLPGLKKEYVKVELEDKTTLKISGERHKEEVKETDKWHRVERSVGKFLRRFRLPEHVDHESIKAKFENGVLEVNVPKLKGKIPELKSIDVAGEPEQSEAADGCK